MADWEEVKRLAADFQKVQLSSTTQKLSERNCIEIVSWLLERKMVDLIFTSDGKEYLTPSQLVSDIRGELYDSGGRVNLVELAKTIGVDLAHINNHMNEVLRSNKEIQSILGQLIDSSYITRIAGEINEKLLQQGQINVSDLTIQYDLPADFLQQQVIEKNLGKIIFGKQDRNDPKLFFTESFIARSKAKIRGALAGLTKPTSVSLILSHIDLSEKLLFSLFDQTAMYGSLTSKQTGSQYVPNVYARSQNDWVNQFYKQNGYLEYDALTRLGISDHKNYIKKQLASEEYKTLNSLIVSKNILERMEADIEECISSKSFLDMQSNLPSVFNQKDIEMVLDLILTGQRLAQTVVIDSHIISKAFMDNLSDSCGSMLNENAKNIVESGKYQQHQISLQAACLRSQKSEEVEEKVDKREERRKKAAGGKSGGGTQGRETKTKSTKKAGRSGNRNNSESEQLEESAKKSSLEIISFNEIRATLLSALEEEGIEDDVIDGIVSHLLPKLNEKGLEIASNIYSITVADRTATRRQTHNELQNKLNLLIGDVRLFEKADIGVAFGCKKNEQNKRKLAFHGFPFKRPDILELWIKAVPSENWTPTESSKLCGEHFLPTDYSGIPGLKLLPQDLQALLVKYLLKTLCTDVVNEILNYVATELNLNAIAESFNVEQRSKFVNDLPAEYRNALAPLVKSLVGQNIDDFLSAVDAALACCSMILKKIDKKKDRTTVLNHKHQLLEELNRCEDVALVLHLAILAIFTSATQCMLHCSGRHVAGVLSFLKQYLSEVQAEELTSYHDFVTLMLGGGSEVESAKEKLKEKIPAVKNIANEYKKPGIEKS